MDKIKLGQDLAELKRFRDELNKNIRHLTSPMSAGMCKGSDLAVKSLRQELKNCERRIKNIESILPPEPIIISLIRRPLPDLDIYALCSVQPMTGNTNG